MYDMMPINLVSFANELPVMAKDISEATRKDPVLSKCYEYTLNGWLNHVTDDQLKPLEFKVHTRVHGRPVNTPAATLNGLIQRAVGNLHPLLLV